MINEHDIADMMDQTFKAMPEEKKKVEFIAEGEELVMDMHKFLMGYTEALLGVLQVTLGHKKEQLENIIDIIGGLHVGGSDYRLWDAALELAVAEIWELK